MANYISKLKRKWQVKFFRYTLKSSKAVQLRKAPLWKVHCLFGLCLGRGGEWAKLQHRTCDILDAERSRLMRFDNWLIVVSLKVVCCSRDRKGKPSILWHKPRYFDKSWDLCGNSFQKEKVLCCSSIRKNCIVTFLTTCQDARIQEALPFSTWGKRCPRKSVLFRCCLSQPTIVIMLCSNKKGVF